MKVNLPMQNSRYRGPIESIKIENILNMLSFSAAELEKGLQALRKELGRMDQHSAALYNAVYGPRTALTGGVEAT